MDDDDDTFRKFAYLQIYVAKWFYFLTNSHYAALPHYYFLPNTKYQLPINTNWLFVSVGSNLNLCVEVQPSRFRKLLVGKPLEDSRYPSIPEFPFFWLEVSESDPDNSTSCERSSSLIGLRRLEIMNHELVGSDISALFFF